MVAAEDPTQGDVEDAAEQPVESPKRGRRSGDDSSNLIDFEEATRDGEDGDEDGDASKKRIGLRAAVASLTALTVRLRPSLRQLAVAGVVVLIFTWTAMLWQITSSFASMGDSARMIAAELVAPPPLAASVTEAEALTVTESGAMVLALALALEPPPPIDIMWTEPPAVEVVPAAPRMLFGRPVNTNGVDAWDCSDFETWEQAKIVYDANLPQDPNILDFFRTGVPCNYLYLATAE